MKALILFNLLITLTAFSQTPVEKGISRELATWRKQHISSVSYNLSFDIPSQLKNNVTAFASINFKLDQIPTQPVQLDFKSSSAHLSSLTINNNKSVPSIENEHILLPASLLKKGLNTVSVAYDSVGAPMKRSTPNLIYCLFVPAKAREVFPCFDQPDLKAVFTLKLTTSSRWMGVSNGAVSKTAVLDSLRTTSFAATRPISTYLFSFAAAPFKMFVSGKHTFYYTQSDSARLGNNPKENMRLNLAALDFLTNYTGIPYSFSKFDFVEVSGFSISGMEHPGSIFYSDKTIMLAKPSEAEKIRRAGTIGHEVSHMWFGDLVTMKWFNEVWLKEVFANFFGDQFAASQTGGNDLSLSSFLSNHPNAFVNDRLPSAEPINRQLPNLNQAGLAYGYPTYNKAPIMMRQLQLEMGATGFQKGVQDYIRKYAGGNADFSQLINCLQPYTKTDLKNWSHEWVDLPGRPLINCVPEVVGGQLKSFTISQQRQQQNSSLLPQQFSISLYYDSTHVDTLRVYLKGSSLVLPVNKPVPRYVMFNSTGEGYGVFPLDEMYLNDGMAAGSPTARAATLVNLFERLLRGGLPEAQTAIRYNPAVSSTDVLQKLGLMAARETNPQILDRVLRYMEFIYWRIMSPTQRMDVSGSLEKALRTAGQIQNSSANQRSIFMTWVRTLQSSSATEGVRHYLTHQSELKSLSLTVDHWNAVALELALRNDPAANTIMRSQLDSNKGPARQAFEMYIAAASTDAKVRDSLFETFKTFEGRKMDSYVQTALAYLNHPLRQPESIKYLPYVLNLLPDVFEKNDLFFPPSWVAAGFDSYQSVEAADILKEYLAHPHADVPPLLLNKVRQALDWIELVRRVQGR